MTARSALHTAGKVTSASDARLAQVASLAKNGISVLTGVMYAGEQNLLSATATMAVQVKPLHFVGSKTAVEGAYVGANDGPFSLTLAAAPGSGTRVDKIYILQKDSNPGVTSPDATTESVIAATSGALPPGAVQIGTVSIPAGTTKLTDAGVVIATTCRWLAAPGAPLPVRSATERDALTAFTGLTVARLDKDGRQEIYTGTAWRALNFAPFAMAADIQAGFSSGSLAPGGAIFSAQTFPSGRFTVPPAVTATLANGPAGTANLSARAINVTTSGFSLYVYNTAATATSFSALAVSWIAVQMTEGSVSG